MEECITAESIANRIMMFNDSTPSWFLVVEGQNDYNVYKRIINCSQVKIIQAHGKERVQEVLRSLDARNFSSKFAIVDSDFDKISKHKKDDIENLFQTDFHDIEVTIFSTKALEKVIDVLCNEEKVKAFENKKGQSVRNIVLGVAEQIGKLKFINNEKKLGLRFKPREPEKKELKYKNFINDKDLSFLGIDKLATTVIEYSNNRLKGIKNSELIDEFLKMNINQYNIYNLVNGHDLSNILFICIKNVLKSSSSTVNDYNSIEEALILAYDDIDLFNTKLYKQLIEWAEKKQVDIIKTKPLEIRKYGEENYKEDMQSSDITA